MCSSRTKFQFSFLKTFLFLCFVHSYALIGQITLYEDNYPKDLNYVFYNIDSTQVKSFDRGISGEDRIWDYSFLRYDDLDSSFISNDFSVFPSLSSTSNIFDNIVQNEYLDIDFRFLKITKDSVIFNKGLNLTNHNKDMDFSDPLKIFTFPCTYLTEFKDSAIYTYESDTIFAKINFKVDAWGKVTMPSKKTYGVIRIKTNRVDYLDNEPKEVTAYEWWTDKINAPLVSFTIINITGRTVARLILFNDSQYTEIDTSLKIDNVAIFPNPTSDFLKIKFKNQNIQSANVNVYDIQGKLMITEHFNQIFGNIMVGVSNLIPGEYILKVQDENKRVATFPFIKY